MGLFRKKPKPEPDTTDITDTGAIAESDRSDDAAPSGPPADATELAAPVAAAPVTGPVPLTPPAPQIESQRPPTKPNKKAKKVSIDPVDFLNLRAELMDLKARLAAAEQSRAIVESRLAALDATALALSNEQQHAAGAADRLAELEAKVAELGELPRPTAEGGVESDAAAAELRDAHDSLQARLDELAATVAASSSPATDPDLLAKISELEAQVAAATAAAEAARSAAAPAADVASPELSARVDELATRLDAAPDHTNRLAELEARVAEVAARAEMPAPLLAPVGPDPDTVARLDELTVKVAAFEALSAQLAQVNARVIAQAEFGAQLSSLRDRIDQLANDTDIRREAALAAATDAELRDRVNALTDRMAVAEGLAGQMGQLAERVAATDAATRQTAEQVAALEQRVDSVGTELANQLSELGRDIDGLAQHVGDTASGAVSDEVIEALRSGQVKLANEQARYEIAFREDLAALAEHVRRQPR